MSDDSDIEPPVHRKTTRVRLKDGTQIVLPVPSLSPSAVKMFVTCPRQYWFRYVEGVKSPPGVFMVAGTSGHKALEVNNRHKIEKGDDLKTKAVVEAFRDDWSDRSKEVPASEFHREGTTKDKVADLVVPPLTAYMTKAAPRIRPVKSEQRFETDFLGVPVLGYIDLLDSDGRVCDYKVSGPRSPYLKSAYADDDIQLAFYAAALKAEKAAFIVLVKGGGVQKTPTATPKARRNSIRREVVHVAKAISAGSFPKCPPGSWYCSPRWCGYHHLCRGARDGRGREPS